MKLNRMGDCKCKMLCKPHERASLQFNRDTPSRRTQVKPPGHLHSQPFLTTPLKRQACITLSIGDFKSTISREVTYDVRHNKLLEIQLHIFYKIFHWSDQWLHACLLTITPSSVQLFGSALTCINQPCRALTLSQLIRGDISSISCLTKRDIIPPSVRQLAHHFILTCGPSPSGLIVIYKINICRCQSIWPICTAQHNRLCINSYRERALNRVNF